jgi:hypothetical protein
MKVNGMNGFTTLDEPPKMFVTLLPAPLGIGTFTYTQPQQHIDIMAQ